MSGQNGVSFKELFNKDIEQSVNGVIKANDEKELDTEVSEYVLTDEIRRNLDKFFDSYNDQSNHEQNGAWISGFFGSGKSHLLKMLSPHPRQRARAACGQGRRHETHHGPGADRPHVRLKSGGAGRSDARGTVGEDPVHSGHVDPVQHRPEGRQVERRRCAAVRVRPRVRRSPRLFRQKPLRRQIRAGP